MATGWFQKATGVFGRREARPQPYSLICDCGVQLSGIRTEAPQRPACPACGTAYLILPACEYPIPATLRRDWFGEELVRKKPHPKAANRPAAPRAEVADRSASQKKSAPTPPAPNRVPAVRRQWRAALTPLRLTALALVVMLIATGLLLLRSSRREWARTHLATAIDRGQEALRQRDFSGASAAFGEAAQAMKLLGRRDAAALAVLQWQREADVAAQLSTSSATELLARLSEDSTNADLVDRFSDHAAGAWMIFDAMVERRTETDGDRCLVDVPLGLGDLPLEVAFDGIPWPTYWQNAASAQPRRMVFAAQWDRIQLPKERNQPARLELRSANAVLWCHYDSLQAIMMASWQDDEESSLRELLREQRTAIGVGETR